MGLLCISARCESQEVAPAPTRRNRQPRGATSPDVKIAGLNLIAVRLGGDTTSTDRLGALMGPASPGSAAIYHTLGLAPPLAVQGRVTATSTLSGVSKKVDRLRVAEALHACVLSDSLAAGRRGLRANHAPAHLDDR